MPEPTSSLEIIACPECGVPAEVVGEFTLGSTHGAVEHLVTMCVRGHALTPRTETIPEYATGGSSMPDATRASRDRGTV